MQTRDYGFTLVSDGAKEHDVGIINAVVCVNGSDFMTNAIDAQSYASEHNLKFTAGVNATVYAHFWTAEIKSLGPARIQLLVTDGAESCKKAKTEVIKTFPWIIGLWCECHLLSLWGSDIASDKFLVQLRGQATSVVSLVRNYGWVLQEFNKRRALQRQMTREEVAAHSDGAMTKLKRFATTRFFYIFLVFESLLKAHGALAEIVNLETFQSVFLKTQVTKEKKAEVEKAVTAIKSDGFWIAMENTITILKPLYIAMRVADSSKPSGGRLYWQLYCIKSGKAHAEIFNTLQPDSPLLSWFKEKMAPRMEHLMVPVVQAAFMLDPRYHAERMEIRNTDMEEWSTLLSAVHKIAEKVFDPAKAQWDTALNEEMLENWQEQAVVQLEQFHAQSHMFDKFTFKGWKKVTQEMDLSRWACSQMVHAGALRYLMMHILSLVFSSSAAERNYSTWSNIWSDDRARMKFENAKDRVYLYCNTRSLDAKVMETFSSEYILHVAGDGHQVDEEETGDSEQA